MTNNQGKAASVGCWFICAYWHDPRWKKFVGATVKIRDLADNLTSLGCEVVVFLPKYHFDTEQLSFKIVEVPFLNIPMLRLISFNIFLSVKLLIFGLRNRPDVVYSRRMVSVIPAIYSMLRRATFFYEINDDPYATKNCDGKLVNVAVIRSKLAIKIDEFNLKLCRKAVVISEAIEKKILSHCSSLPPSKFILLPSGANTELFRPLKKIECRLMLKLEPENNYIYFAGTLLEHQGIDTLILAAPYIKDKFPECNFVVSGEGPMKERWISRTQKTGLAHSFLFTGQIDYEEMPCWIGASDICVAPYNYAAGLRSPVKVFDYMACGRAVIASKIPGTSDIFQESEAVKLIDAENPSALAQAVVDLLGDENVMTLMGQKGRAFVVSQCSRRSLSQKILLAAADC